LRVLLFHGTDTLGKRGIERSGKINGSPQRDGRVSVADNRDDAQRSGRMECGGRHGWIVVVELGDSFCAANRDPSVPGWYLFDEEDLHLNQRTIRFEEWASEK
jgi:hypothetical protein